MLEECLDSLVLQNGLTTIVVIYPQKSQPNILEIIKKFPTVIFEAQDLKMIDSVNYAFQKYRDHEFANWLGDDDLLTSGSIRRILQMFEENPEIIGVFGGCDYIDEAGFRIATYNPPKFAAKLCGFIPAAIKLEGGLFRLGELLSAGGIDPIFRYCPDIDVTLKLRRRGRWSKVSGPPVSNFRIHSDSVTALGRRSGMREARQIQYKYGNKLEKSLVFTVGLIVQEAKVAIFYITEKFHKVRGFGL